MVDAARISQEAPVERSGARLGIRTGVALPMGPLYQSSGALADVVSMSVPLRLDLGYRIGGHVYVGAATQLSMLVPSGCTSGMTCSGNGTQVSILLAYHALPDRRFDPWVGVGTGYEMMQLHRSSGGMSVDVSARGWDFGSAELGCDYRAGTRMRLGPVLAASFGSFTSVAVNGAAATDFSPAMHAWVTLGFRIASDL
jgi:hypothetical protein